jgi:hypothetical protein
MLETRNLYFINIGRYDWFVYKLKYFSILEHKEKYVQSNTVFVSKVVKYCTC